MNDSVAVFRGPGRALYEAYRDAHNSNKTRVAFAGTLPRWKRLKPKTMKLWNETAERLGDSYDNPYKYGQNVAGA